MYVQWYFEFILILHGSISVGCRVPTRRVWKEGWIAPNPHKLGWQAERRIGTMNRLESDEYVEIGGSCSIKVAYNPF